MKLAGLCLAALACFALGCGNAETPDRPSTNQDSADAAAEDARRVNEARADVANLRTLVKLFYMETGRYPGELPELTRPTEGEPHGYIEKLPIDPWGEDYWYELEGGLRIFSKGPDRAVGTEDDVTDQTD